MTLSFYFLPRKYEHDFIQLRFNLLFYLFILVRRHLYLKLDSCSKKYNI